MARKVFQSQRKLIIYRVAVVYGLCIGCFLFLIGLPGLFSLGANDTPLTILGGFCGTLAVLPLTVLAIFRPRAGGWALVVNSLVVLTLFLVLPGSRWTLPAIFDAAWRILGLYVLTPALFLYATPQPERNGALPSGDREHEVPSPGTPKWHPARSGFGGLDAARIAASLIGVIFGSIELAWGWRFAVAAVRLHSTASALQIAALSAGLLVCSILGIFRPGTAAWALAAVLGLSFGFTFAPAFHSTQPEGWAAGAGGVVLWLILSLPTWAACGLFFYASRGTSQREDPAPSPQ